MRVIKEEPETQENGVNEELNQQEKYVKRNGRYDAPSSVLKTAAIDLRDKTRNRKTNARTSIFRCGQFSIFLIAIALIKMPWADSTGNCNASINRSTVTLRGQGGSKILQRAL